MLNSDKVNGSLKVFEVSWCFSKNQIYYWLSEEK